MVFKFFLAGYGQEARLSLVRRVHVPKGCWSEGLLVRRVVGPKGRWSEGLLVKRVVGPKCCWSEGFSPKGCKYNPAFECCLRCSIGIF